MLNNLKERCKIQKSNVDKAYEYSLGLRYNEEYEKMVDNIFLEFANLFKEIYPNVSIEPPRGRVKSKKSIKNKIQKLEIERLCKLYAIGQISDEEKESLNSFLSNITKKQTLEAIIKGIKENLSNEEIEKLHSPLEYLKIKDLRAFKFVVVDVPDDIQTENRELIQAIKKRKECLNEEKSKYNDLCCIELTKDFASKLMKDKELLEKLNLEILPEGYKHKQKDNGYIAEHIKFCFRNHPEYTFEMQLRSIYREEISRANGKAAHDKRLGKKREFPSVEDKKTFIQELKNILPEYKMLKYEDKQFKLYKCTMFENMLEYFLGYVNLDSKEYKNALEYVKENEEIQK